MLAPFQPLFTPWLNPGGLEPCHAEAWPIPPPPPRANAGALAMTESVRIVAVATAKFGLSMVAPLLPLRAAAR